MKRRYVILVLVLATFLSSCIFDMNSSTPETLTAEDYKTIPVDNLFQLDVPEYMKEMPSLHPEGSLEYANIFKEAYTVVIHEDKEEFVTVFTELDEYDADKSIVENYMSVQKKMFDENISNLRVEDYSLTEINGYPARQIKAYGRVEDLDASYVIAFIEGEDNIYMIMNWTIEDRMQRFETTFEHINGTFKLM